MYYIYIILYIIYIFCIIYILYVYIYIHIHISILVGLKIVAGVTTIQTADQPTIQVFFMETLAQELQAPNAQGTSGFGEDVDHQP